MSFELYIETFNQFLLHIQNETGRKVYMKLI